MSSFNNKYNPKIVEKIANAIQIEFNKMDGAEKQHNVVAEMLLDATMDAISEYEVFETFKEKNPEASVTLQNFDAKLDYTKFMKLHLESPRNSIQ